MHFRTFLEAAQFVLMEAGRPLAAQEIVEQVSLKGLCQRRGRPDTAFNSWYGTLIKAVKSGDKRFGRVGNSDVFFAAVVEEEIPEDDTQHFYNDVSRSLQENHSSRQARLATAPRIPDRISTTSSSFRRNPDVVAEVLLRAEGKCEGCLQPAPFARASDGTPYLEVHHHVMLAAGGEDTVVNAIALCPNCHRAAHYA